MIECSHASLLLATASVHYFAGRKTGRDPGRRRQFALALISVGDKFFSARDSAIRHVRCISRRWRICLRRGCVWDLQNRSGGTGPRGNVGAGDGLWRLSQGNSGLSYVADEHTYWLFPRRWRNRRNHKRRRIVGGEDSFGVRGDLRGVVRPIRSPLVRARTHGAVRDDRHGMLIVARRSAFGCFHPEARRVSTSGGRRGRGAERRDIGRVCRGGDALGARTMPHI